MKKKRSKIVTVALVMMIVGLVGTVFYITNILVSEKSKVAPQRSKAADITYSKDINLRSSSSLSPTTGANEPALSPTPKNFILPMPSPTTEPVSPTATDTPSTTTPTSGYLAQNPPTPTGFSSQSSDYQSTGGSTEGVTSPTPTTSTSLPQTGLVGNTLIVFAASTLLVFFAFLF